MSWLLYLDVEEFVLLKEIRLHLNPKLGKQILYPNMIQD